ncbi:MAG: hypothetical protein ACLPXM_00390 [Terriglobales bacterium]
MTKSFVFVSCGQYTEAEKSLGRAIIETVKSATGLDAFFAEEVHDLNGLDSNILAALRDCAALIVVMHPRGRIVRPGGSELVRASVWIEQEIAIATYIQRVERRRLPVVAFVHESVSREGLRGFLHLNPIHFSDESEVLAALPARLQEWKGLTAGGTPDADAARTAVRSLIEATKDLKDAARSFYELHTHTQPGVTWPATLGLADEEKQILNKIHAALRVFEQDYDLTADVKAVVRDERGKINIALVRLKDYSNLVLMKTGATQVQDACERILRAAESYAYR